MPNLVSNIIAGQLVDLVKPDATMAQSLFDSVQTDIVRLSIFLPWPKFIKTVDDELNWIQDSSTKWDKQEVYSYIIFRSSDKKLIGAIDLHHINWKTMQGEIGYWILGAYEGQGLVVDAVKTLEQHFFSLGFNKIEIRSSAKNIRSANIPQICGYLYDGMLKEDGFDQDGLRNTMIFSKLKLNYNSNFISSKTELDLKAVIDIAKNNPHHFTKSGVELIEKDFSFLSGLIYRSNDIIVGFLLYFCNQGISEIGWMGVNPNYQNKNIGSQLIKELVTILKSKKISELIVKTLDESVDYAPYNKTRKFYEKNGFKKIKVILHPENPECEAEAIYQYKIF